MSETVTGQPGSAATRSVEKRHRAALAREVQQHLGQHLQATYSGLGEPFPNEFNELLNRLEQALSARDGDGLAEHKRGILAAVPSLRAFAISLTYNEDQADDLVQETILRALAKRDSFRPGTNLQAWLFTILRNHFHTTYRKRKREVEDGDGIYAARLKSAPEQLHKLEIHDLHSALQQLAPEQREAVLLVAAEGLSYEDAAAICGVAVGTIKSRVNRARTHLAKLMGYTKGDLAADNVLEAALTSSN
jgi:RNA polymerase sigma-70 factor (ECF subfamily)